jgi:hypothetical protein
MNLKNLSIQELKDLSTQIKEEINSRESQKLVVYTHNCKDSANYHKRKYKHWSKLVKVVDTTKTNGYAFIGDFLNIDYEHKVKVGSIIVEVCSSTIKAYKTNENGFELIAEAGTNSMSEFIDKISLLI